MKILILALVIALNVDLTPFFSAESETPTETEAYLEVSKEKKISF